MMDAYNKFYQFTIYKAYIYKAYISN